MLQQSRYAVDLHDAKTFMNVPPLLATSVLSSRMTDRGCNCPGYWNTWVVVVGVMGISIIYGTHSFLPPLLCAPSVLSCICSFFFFPLSSGACMVSFVFCNFFTLCLCPCYCLSLCLLPSLSICVYMIYVYVILY